ncbi:MAG: HypC/HybG/HupF family hydrogenase formation chaperone [Deltaproteobacteria bacterium CG_4_10_14_3_um_filter_60_8]|nr:MAG: hydrogenase expression protein [Desulfobacterales bacterium CG2_30_60_27]PIY21445.1 MAG: HypC/HybG/HupF family hydrogenase formation chaperone [Deltaproteobacteria bacterium CG_4_10_14_3_um_filter_60_8]
MCLAVPGKVIAIMEEGGLKTGRIDYSGMVNTVCLELVPDIVVGQYTVVHAGFALSIIDEAEALQSLETWAEFLELQRVADGPGRSEPENP